MSEFINKCNCALLATVASIAVGIIAAVLLFTAVITVAPAFYWVALGIAVGFLAIALATSLTACECNAGCCRGSALGAFVLGALGTILASLILLGVGFAATSAIGAVVFGILLFFLSLLVTSTACVVKCYID